MKFRRTSPNKNIFHSPPATAWPPGHFYSPIPAIEDIQNDEASIFFTGNKSLGGIDLNEAGQKKLLAELGQHYDSVPFSDDRQANLRFYYNNPNFSYGEAVLLFCLINLFRPARIVEIGSGYSSCVTLDANEILRNHDIQCVFIEPYPELFLSLIKPDDPEKITLIDRKVQQTDMEIYSTLQKNDILFVDSSHVVKTGGDVNFILFEILPDLQPGVLIHFHDIGFPFEYPKAWVYQGRAWNETYFLRAFLQYNRAFRIEFYSAFMAEFHRELFGQTLPICSKNFGTSFWMRKVAN
jgi:hypothetical protein